MELVYSQARQPGRKRLNPRFFDGIVEGVTTVYLDGDWPKIAAAYEAAGVKVLRLDFVAPVHRFEMPAVQREPVSIPADWRDLPWSQPDERGLSLRSVAASVSDTPVINKAQAFAAIEAHLSSPD